MSKCVIKVHSQEWVDRLVGAGCKIVRDDRASGPSGPTGAAYLTHPELRYVGRRDEVWYGIPWKHYRLELPGVGLFENFRGNAMSVSALHLFV